MTIDAIAPASVPVASASICCFTSSLVRRTWSRRRATRSAFFERAFDRVIADSNYQLVTDEEVKEAVAAEGLVDVKIAFDWEAFDVRVYERSVRRIEREVPGWKHFPPLSNHVRKVPTIVARRLLLRAQLREGHEKDYPQFNPKHVMLKSYKDFARND